MVQHIGIASFTCDNFLSIELDFFYTLSEHHKLKKSTSESRESLDIFVSRILQPRVNDTLFSYYFKTLKQ